MNEQLTPEQAIQNLDNAVAQIPTSRQVHVTLQASLRLLQGIVAEWRKRQEMKIAPAATQVIEDAPCDPSPDSSQPS